MPSSRASLCRLVALRGQRPPVGPVATTGKGRHSWLYASPSHPPADTGPVHGTAATKAAPPETLVIAPKDATESVGRPSAPRHLLPKDLPGALARLDDGEIDVLLTAVIGEAKRRDRLSSNLMAKSLDSDQRPRKVSQSKTAVKYARAHPRQAHADDDAASLTQGQVNAVRAAFKAGIKPSMIARQFGSSQSNVRKVLASQAQERKS